jgi:hypothetical protein
MAVTKGQAHRAYQSATLLDSCRVQKPRHFKPGRPPTDFMFVGTTSQIILPIMNGVKRPWQCAVPQWERGPERGESRLRPIERLDPRVSRRP